MNTDKCRSMHFGLWAIEPNWFNSAVQAVRTGMMKPRGRTVDVEGEGSPEPTRPPYEMVGRIAIIKLEGPLMKARSKYGGTSTVDVRSAVRAAVADDAVAAIILGIDSPGGTVAGTDALAQDIAAANVRKPVYAHIQDMGASAAYYIASQARIITAERTSLVGSLGVVMTLVDSSEAAAMAGLKVVPITTGGMKGAGIDGTPLTPEQLAAFQVIVDDAGRHFRNAVRSGRSLTDQGVNTLFDGRVHDADRAVNLKLVDAVSTLDALVSFIEKEITGMKMTIPVPGSPGNRAAPGSKFASPAPPARVSTESDAASQAASEWESNFDGCRKQFVSESVYVAFRKAELRGQARAVSGTVQSHPR